ncbi:M6 metalloprotease [Westerdykella ornata]|uniref:M6 metalloprotease n=1 Tax=Westerdykella ornata TaxID=318751 RepID=A0A6A6J706_WESOR|nr:M6 metalloprotease [Westerdykella ornata]KAF2272004.1 M6 metalloprotease [Westerdykella ornata]
MARTAVQAALLASCALSAYAAPSGHGYGKDVFAVLDPQKWVNPDNMTWKDYRNPPGTHWSDPSRKGSSRNFNIAMVAVDYPDLDFAVTRPPNSDVYGNPQPSAANLKRSDVPAFYRDLLNKPNDLNQGHTLHEYWMGDSLGKYGVDLTAFGPYRLPRKSFQYGIDDEEDGFNEGACPEPPCSVDLRTDALGAWRADVGNATANSFELVFILSAGQDESSTWQEFGEMKFMRKEDIPDEFGPPGNRSLPNYANTRYVEWTSWAAASNIWPNAGGGSSTQGESSGMATFAHELSHLLGIGDNYNNPYGTPQRRAYSGPFSMLDRGSFNGPGGPHTRWQIPPVQGASMGSLHTMRDKHHIGLITNAVVLQVSRDALAESGLIVAEITARAVDPGTGLMGINITLPNDLSPPCNTSTDPLCDGGRYNAYNVEVIDRMGADSFVPDSGVMISKSKFGDAPQPFQWVIDANPQDIKVVDFIRPDGTPKYYTIGDYRQLSDALFHAGTRSGSQFEYVDKANKLHFYVININRDESGVLRYIVGVRSLAGSGPSQHGVQLKKPNKEEHPTGTLYTFELKNKGKFAKSNASHPQDLSKYLDYDIYRVEAKIEGEGWKVVVPNALATAEFGKSTEVSVAVGGERNRSKEATVTVTVTSESDPTKKEEQKFKVRV